MKSVKKKRCNCEEVATKNISMQKTGYIHDIYKNKQLKLGVMSSLLQFIVELYRECFSMD